MNEFIIFGTTRRAEWAMQFLCNCHLDSMVRAFCALDKDLRGSSFYGKPVLLWDEASALRLPFYLAANQEARPVASYLLQSCGLYYSDNLIHLLSTQFDLDPTWLNRQYCQYWHEHHMDDYYENAEHKLGTFWNPDSPFYRMFSLLDLTAVVELACGHGRHVEKYRDQAGSITLVDISEKNIAFCKQRFGEDDKIRYYKNSGCDLQELASDAYSAIFSYDSMVHFELMDIYRYLTETRRILQKGGRGLFHHSNLMLDPRQSYYQPFNKGGRNYMSKDLFAYLAYQAGLTVVEQKVINWSLPNMDCITLVEKR